MALSPLDNDVITPFDDQIFTVSQFLDIVNDLVATVKVTIQGEITSFDVRGTNIFASISDTKAQAKLSLYIYKPTLDRLGIVLEKGTEVAIRGTPSIYKPNGNFSLRVSSVSLVGEGQLKAAFDRMVAKLQSEGPFEQTHKRQIPEFPMHIGVISSAAGDALTDFRKHMLPYNFHIHFVDARVEGPTAIDSVITAFRTLNESNLPLDVIVLTRGGGSLESLQAFNSEPVARAIRASRVPVISAIGHEQDVTISDYVADLRASTPTDAAKLLSLNWLKASEKIRLIESSLYSNFRKTFVYTGNRFDTLYAELFNQYQHGLAPLLGAIQHAEELSLSYLGRLRSVSERMEQRQTFITQNLSQQLRKQSKILETHHNMLEVSIKNTLRYYHQTLTMIEKSITGNDPRNRLRQGYSITTTANGAVLKSSEDVAVGEKLRIHLQRGIVQSEVTDRETTV